MLPNSFAPAGKPALPVPAVVQYRAGCPAVEELIGIVEALGDEGGVTVVSHLSSEAETSPFTAGRKPARYCTTAGTGRAGFPAGAKLLGSMVSYRLMQSTAAKTDAVDGPL